MVGKTVRRCSDRCRKAASRRQKAKIEAEAVFKTNLQIAKNAHHDAYMLERYRGCATTLHMQAEHYGVRVRFMGTPRGILAVEEVPGAIRLAAARLDWPGGSTLRMYRETENPELLALLPSPFQGGARMTDEGNRMPS